MLDLSRLSPEQRQVVTAPEGPLLVLAGPGSGKTTVLLARVTYLVAFRRVPPSSILLLAFARRAVRELRERLGGLLGEQGLGVDVATFHAFGLRVVRDFREELGFAEDPLAICPPAEARSLLREAARACGLDLGSASLPTLAARLERYRLGREDDSDGDLRELAAAYDSLLRRRNTVDYPAMLALPLGLFREHPCTLQVLQDAYRHVLVDEFQDVCGAQYELARLLAWRHRNLVAVGDSRQCLYGWRGAHVRFVEEFRRDFPEARLLGLDENYRSTGLIVELANALGAKLAPSRPIWTDNPPGLAPVCHIALDGQAEAEFIAGEIGWLLRAGLISTPGEAAVLYRANWQADEIALALRERHLPYRVLGHTELLARREVRDALAYLRLAHNPNDSLALARVVDVPPRRLGWLAEALRAGPVSLTELPTLATRRGAAARAAAQAFAELVVDLRSRSAGLRPAEVLDLALELSGYRTWLARQTDVGERVANLARLRALAERADGDLGWWLTDLALDETPDADDPERVLLTTIHGAKGGEWRAVFVVGFEEGLLPHYRSFGDELREDDELASRIDGIEEERRVAYVAVTRAREYLYLIWCRRRRRGGAIELRQPSRFLRGLPVDLRQPTGAVA